MIGLIVDSVSEVIKIQAKEIASPLSHPVDGSGKYNLGFAKIAGELKILLDIEKIVDKKEFDQIIDSVTTNNRLV